MGELVDPPDLNSRVNCSNKSLKVNIGILDWIVPNNLDNPVDRKVRAGSTPAPSTKFKTYGDRY